MTLAGLRGLAGEAAYRLDKLPLRGARQPGPPATAQRPCE